MLQGLHLVVPCVGTYDAIPKPATLGSAGLDIRASHALSIRPGKIGAIDTDLKVAIPAGFCGLVLPRSGIATKHGVTLANSPGLIDSDYRGEVRVCLINHGEETYIVQPGDRIAQLLIVAFAPVTMLTVTPEAFDALATPRGDGGFGSTGAA